MDYLFNAIKRLRKMTIDFKKRKDIPEDYIQGWLNAVWHFEDIITKEYKAVTRRLKRKK